MNQEINNSTNKTKNKNIIYLILVVVILIILGSGLWIWQQYIQSIKTVEQDQKGLKLPFSDDKIPEGKYFIGSRFSDETDTLGIPFQSGAWNGSYWLLTSNVKGSSLIKYDGENIENLSGFIKGDDSPKVFWNGQYWLILDEQMFPKKTFLYKYTGNRNLTDLTDKQIADRITHIRPLPNNDKLWLLGGGNGSVVDKTFGKIILYDGLNFQDLTSRFKHNLQEIAKVYLIAAGQNQWFVQLWHQGAPTIFSSYIVSSEGEVSSVDLPSERIRSIEWVRGKWLIGLFDGTFLAYYDKKLHKLNDRIGDIKLTAIQANEQDEVLVFGLRQTQSLLVSAPGSVGELYIYYPKDDLFKEIELKFSISGINWDDELFEHTSIGGTIGYSKNGWIISGGRIGEAKDNRSYYIDSRSLKAVDISLNIKQMIIRRAIWNDSYWLLFGLSRIYKFIPGHWDDSLPTETIITSDRKNIYLFSQNKKHLIVHDAVFNARYKWENIIYNSEIPIDEILDGPPINTFPDDSIISSEKGVYIIKDGRYHLIKNSEDYFLIYPELKEKIIKVPHNLVLNHPEGDSIDFKIPSLSNQPIEDVFTHNRGSQILANTKEGIYKIISIEEAQRWLKENNYEYQEPSKRTNENQRYGGTGFGDISLSPDKNYIAFSVGSAENIAKGWVGIYSVSKKQIIFLLPYGQTFSWSPTNNSIAYFEVLESTNLQRLQVVSIPKQKSTFSFPEDVKLLISKYRLTGDIQWDNNRDTLTFSVFNKEKEAKEFYSVNADGTNLRLME